MAGRGPNPKDATARRRANEPIRGEWDRAPVQGWKHGLIPKPPSGLLTASRDAWQAWFSAWFAAHWEPFDVPLLSQVIVLFDKVQRDSATASERSELRQMLDGFGVTKKGQQDRRWAPPKVEEPAQAGTSSEGKSRYGHLRAVVAG